MTQFSCDERQPQRLDEGHFLEPICPESKSASADLDPIVEDASGRPWRVRRIRPGLAASAWSTLATVLAAALAVAVIAGLIIVSI